MLSFYCNPITININLGNGVYYMGSDSATGKTYMSNLLNMASLPEVLVFTYQDIKKEIDVPRLVYKRAPKLIIFDRYDMYGGKFEDLICEFADKAIILIDCKEFDTFANIADYCIIKRTADKIEVI